MLEMIRKRNGNLVAFNDDKIANAVKKALAATGVPEDEREEIARDVTDCTISALAPKHMDSVPTVEEVQDEVERALIKMNLADAAKSYIIYRRKRQFMRDSGSMLNEQLKELFDTSAQESDLKRDNANVDGDCAMGTMLQVGAAASKSYYTENYLTDEQRKANQSGDIHIHDFDFYALTETCCQIDLKKLFEHGFSTGHGYLREPQSIQSYAALACIAIQSNQNDQHGGQAVPNFDYAMADGVRKTYAKEFEAAMSSLYEDMMDFEPGEGKAPVKAAIEATEMVPAMGDSQEFDKRLLEQMVRLTANHMENDLAKIIRRAHKRALMKADKATHQAMESLVHNLNSMHSRAGAQVPFSSINYGTDTSPEGRMVIENVLKATMEGLGNGETPIFPIQIFKVKDGVNYNEGDPNYDLFKYSMKVSAKRLFPNYTFIDAPFNLQYYVPGHPETEIATMGCVRGSDYITFKLDGKLLVLPFAEAYDVVKAACGIEVNYGKSKYVPCEGRVTIYDSNERAFVGCKKFIKNPNQNNWMHLVTDNGRTLYATADHPLPVFSKGRTFMRDIETGDRIRVTYDQYAEYGVHFDPDEAWLLGLILTDGCYQDSSPVISLGPDELDIVEKVQAIGRKMGYKVTTKTQNHGTKGTYMDVLLSFGSEAKKFNERVTALFMGVNKADRKVPSEVFTWDMSAKRAFFAGMMDGDGYVNVHMNGSGAKCGRFMIGSTNHALALGQMLLLQAMGIAAKIYENKYRGQGDNAIRYRIESCSCDKIAEYMASEKKRSVAFEHPGCAMNNGGLAKVTKIEAVALDEESYDVETESDRFDVSGILSHNCRTRVMGNVHDPATVDEQGVYHPNGEIAYGRGNLSFTSINLPRLAILANHDEQKFFDSLNKMMELVARQLLDRLEIQSRRKVYNYPFLMGQGVWRGSDKLRPTDEVREVLKDGTLSIGFIGLAETLTALYGHHHGESDEMEEKGLAIVRFMRDFCDRKAQETKLNFSLLATPAEGLSGHFVRKDKKLFGIIPGVTDRDYYTNSFHIPVWYNISAYDKIQKEAPFHALTNAGHITYVELDGDVANNLDAFESVVRCMHDAGVGYGSINHPVDRDPVCGYVGVIGDVCPRCGRRAGEGVSAEKLDKLRKMFPEMPYYAKGIV